MIDSDILEQAGSTKQRLREVFTAKAGTADFEIRKRVEDEIEARIHEGLETNMRNYRVYTVSDLAWDSQIITKEIIPLMLYAQGRIDVNKLATQLKDISTSTLKKFAELDGAGNIKDINLSKFMEVSVNLIRSFVTRKTAALSVERTKLTPFFKFDPVSTSFVAKLRGDVLSQRVEVMTNQYGYRHDLPQAVRDSLLYSHSVEFPSGAWDVQRQWFKKKRADGLDTSSDKKFEVEARIVREGLHFVRPHPTRVFYDNAFPLSSINTDTGCEYIGYWTVVRFKEVEKNTDYFNRNEVSYSTRSVGVLTSNRPYFELYFPNANINFPSAERNGDLAASNDREQNVGTYSGTDGDKSIALVEYRMRVVPKEIKVGDYPYPVWLRLVVAGARTVVYAEFLPSLPAVYYGYNEDDSRQINPSLASDAMPWQDQMSNLVTQMLTNQKTSLIKIIAANIDILTPEMLVEFRRIVKGERYTNGPMLLEFKGEQLEQLGLDIEDVVSIVQTNGMADISSYFGAIGQLLSLAERVLNISAQEQGQSAKHELSATEVTEISNTTNVMASFTALGIDEGLAAKKRLIYEALVSMGNDEIYVPVVNRYSEATIKAAGFEVVDEEDEADVRENYAGPARSQTVTGSKQALIYDYTFNSRDGAERASSAKAAEVLVNLLSQLGNIPGLLQDMGKEKLYKLINHIVRMSGAGVDLTFELQDGESADLPAADAEANNRKEIQDVIRQVLDAIEKDRQRIGQLENALGVAPSPAAPPAAVPPASSAIPGAISPAQL